MTILKSKTKSVTMEFLVRNSHGNHKLIVEIGDIEIIFRALSCRTECYVQQAKLNPQRIANCLFALDPHALTFEVEQITRHIMMELI